MEENIKTPQELPKQLPPVTPVAAGAEKPQGISRGKIILIVAVAVLLIAGVITALVLLYSQGADVTGRVRDIFIIFMALESLIIGVALIILIVQLALLTNLLQHEIKPIIDSTNETVSTIRGTAAFLSDNLAEPVIKLNGYLASLKAISDLINPGRKK